MNFCCDTMFMAFQYGTDSESYGPLFRLRDDKQGIFGGNHLIKLNYCPWCATDISAVITPKCHYSPDKRHWKCKQLIDKGDCICCSQCCSCG
jgi:hypothetical protein